MMFEDRATEARVRRSAKSMGWRLEKSRARIRDQNNQGNWRLVDDCNIVACGAHYEATLDDCASLLMRADVAKSKPLSHEERYRMTGVMAYIASLLASTTTPPSKGDRALLAILVGIERALSLPVEPPESLLRRTG